MITVCSYLPLGFLMCIAIFGIFFFLMYTYQWDRALSEVPHSKAIAGVRVGLLGDKFVVNPTTKEMEDSMLDLFLAGTDSAILMIEVKLLS